MAVFRPNPTPGAVDPADLIEELGAYLAARYGALEERMIARVSGIVAKGLNPDEYPDIMERLNTAKILRAEGQRLADEVLDPALIARVMQIAASEGEAAALASLGIGNGIPDSSKLTAGAARAAGAAALDLRSNLEDMAQRITRWMPDVYQRTIAMIAPDVILGDTTILQAQQRAAQAFLARGVKGFTNSLGSQMSIGSYAEMATRTLVNRAWQDSSIATMQGQGINLVSIIIGVSACARCAQHAGRIYSTDGTPAGVYEVQAADGHTVRVEVAGTLDEARSTGWNHPNCRCVVVAYLAGFSIPTGERYDPVAERNRDRLRTLERRVRDAKRMQAAAFDDVTKARYGRRVRQVQAQIRQFTDETGQTRRRYREQLSFSDGKPPALPSAPRALTP